MLALVVCHTFPQKMKDGEFVVQPKMLSRRLPTKSILLGVASQPLTYRNSNGFIYLVRVSEQVLANKLTVNTSLSDDIYVNNDIKSGGLRNISDINTPLSVVKCCSTITLNYGLDEAMDRV